MAKKIIIGIGVGFCGIGAAIAGARTIKNRRTKKALNRLKKRILNALDTAGEILESAKG